MDFRVSLVDGLLELKNPVLSASGTFGSGLEYRPYGDIEQLGGIITNGLTLRPCAGAPMPRIAETPGGMLSAVGTQNDGAEHFVNVVLPELPWQEVPIIPNINASNVDEFSELAALLAAERGVAAMEVNLSCRNDHRGGQRFCQNPVTAARAVNAVKRAAGSKPVIAKLSPQIMDIVEVAKAVEAAGADIISCMGTIEGMAVDIISRRPMLGSVIGGLSGPAVKPLALRCVWEISRVVQVPVIGVGGVRSARDVLEFMLAGAHAVAVGTANFSDPGTIFRIIRELPALCEELGIEDLASFRGALKM
ncbi:dihydroorotate dehydrogenase [uncultured Mailhella sp.]|uniref:dihydroorotate dehydrogenase n=1 Tax=uncultured Mailhella sp. TaxID=1981031 RepID=UPI0025DC3876|nr:dihydroorotate dehydrogenase [uncultured Mailhella sp.]